MQIHELVCILSNGNEITQKSEELPRVHTWLAKHDTCQDLTL